MLAETIVPAGMKAEEWKPLLETYGRLTEQRQSSYDYYPVPEPEKCSKPSAKIVADSISSAGVRLTTFEVKLHRFVLAELNTHRVFSRNAASSRAIPIHKQIHRVMTDPAEPVFWGKNKSGMQAAEPLTGDMLHQARVEWYYARDLMVCQAIRLLDVGLHKQLSNRLLEPWMWVYDVISTTKLAGFFFQRCHKDAQPEFQAAARAMRQEFLGNTPAVVTSGNWHLPYILGDEQALRPEELQKISTARCARVSYLTHGGIRDVNEDLAFFHRLTNYRGTEDPIHLSPLEHVAEAAPNAATQSGNFHGWVQLRSKYEPEIYKH